MYLIQTKQITKGRFKGLYTENPLKDIALFGKAVLTNQLARFATTLYVKVTDHSGRGDEETSPEQTAAYFIESFRDYQKYLGLGEDEIGGYLQGKTILEYGPGDILGVALLFYAYGAKTVHCVDRFPLSTKISEKSIAVYRCLLDRLGEAERQRAASAFIKKADPASGLNSSAISYKVTENGLSGARDKYDLIISRAVLEHVNSLEDTFHDIKCSMKNNGTSIHKVDLKSHGLDRYTDFDFLTWPSTIYKLMYSHKGFPNRWRVDKYKRLIESSGLKAKKLTPTGKIPQEKLDIIYPKLARDFKNIPPEEISWTGFLMHLEHDR